LPCVRSLFLACCCFVQSPSLPGDVVRFLRPASWGGPLGFSPSKKLCPASTRQGGPPADRTGEGTGWCLKTLSQEENLCPSFFSPGWRQTVHCPFKFGEQKRNRVLFLMYSFWLDVARPEKPFWLTGQQVFLVGKKFRRPLSPGPGRLSVILGFGLLIVRSFLIRLILYVRLIFFHKLCLRI